MIVVTGGCGYIGSHLVRALVAQGESIVVIDNFSQGRRSAIPPSVECIQLDITDQRGLMQFFTTHEIDVVYHLAALVNAAESAEKRADYIRVNANGSQLVWETALARGVQHFIYASSAAVYGNPATVEPIRESTPLAPSNVYGETKLAGEQSLRTILATHPDANAAIFRFFNVGGAHPAGDLSQNRESRAIMQRLFAAAQNGASVTISGADYSTADGTVIRDFIHVEDIVTALCLAMTHLRAGKSSFTANLGCGRGVSMKEVYTLVSQVSGCAIPVVYGPRVPGDIVSSIADTSEAARLLGWHPTHTMAEIIRDGWNAYVKAN